MGNNTFFFGFFYFPKILRNNFVIYIFKGKTSAQFRFSKGSLYNLYVFIIKLTLRISLTCRWKRWDWTYFYDKNQFSLKGKNVVSSAYSENIVIGDISWSPMIILNKSGATKVFLVYIQVLYSWYTLSIPNFKLLFCNLRFKDWGGRREMWR